MNTRLGMAASLINDPDLLMWDEPTAGLDPPGRKYTLDLIRELGKTKTVIVSSHILSDIDRVCDHVGIVLNGKLIFGGSVRELKQTIGRNNVEIEVDGSESLLDEFCRRLEDVPEIAGFERKGSWMEVRFAPHEQIAVPLGKLCMLAVQMGVEVFSVSSTKGQTEDAFISMLEADHTDGFSRAYSTLPTFPKAPDRVERSVQSRHGGRR
jgi:ABC-2 type transport system ATP-binding protein